MSSTVYLETNCISGRKLFLYVLKYGCLLDLLWNVPNVVHQWIDPQRKQKLSTLVFVVIINWNPNKTS